MHEQKNCRQKEVVTKKEDRARAGTKEIQAGWPGLGRIWPRLVGRARPRLVLREGLLLRALGCVARRKWPDLGWLEGEERGKGRRKERKKKGKREAVKVR